MTKDWVDVDLDRELARIEAEDKKEAFIDNEVYRRLERYNDAEYGAMVRALADRDSDLYTAIAAAVTEQVTEEVNRGELL